MNERLNAELYALTHRGNVGDVAFYREVCRGTRRVLEFGSGYGRMLAALAGAKRNLVGVESNSRLLALARHNLRLLPPAKRNAVRLLGADMREFQTARRFERVIIPYNTVYCLLTRSAALACFRAAHRALLPNGVLAFDVWNAEMFHYTPLSPSSQRGEPPILSLCHRGLTWDVFEHLRVRRAAQRLLATYSYVPRGPGKSVQTAIDQRYFLAAELQALLERAGFAISARFGNFTRSPYSARSPHQIVLARPA